MNAKQHPQSSRRPSSSVATRHRSTGRIAVNVLADGLISALAAPLARFLAAPHDGLLHPLWFVLGGAITLLVSGLPFRIPQQYWRFSGVADLRGIAAASVGGAALFSGLLILTGFPLPSPTFPLIHALVLLVGLGGGRVLTRLLAGVRQQVQGQKSRVLLVGSDLSADLFLRGLERASDRQYLVQGLVTRSPGQQGRRLHGVPILGIAGDITDVLARMAQARTLPDQIIITEPEWRGSQISTVLDAGQRHGIAVQRAPSLTNLTPAEQIQMRPIALEDLLNRPEVPLDREGMARLIQGQVVLVTGAGGTIGSELARQVAQFGPERLLLLDHGEFALWQIDLELSELYPGVPREVIVASIRDAGRVEEIFSRYKPALVFHAAALKHVPIVEANACEGVLTNVIGTRLVADAAIRHSASAMVLISSDKAVNPSSIMGATKRCAEIYCQALAVAAEARGSRFRCVTVRFGNVLGSTGSVVPLFRRQLEQGGPLTVTHPDMTRYFMTVPEAVGLVLQASVRGTASRKLRDETDIRLQQGGIFVLDMGEPVRILDLARQMIRLAGLKPDEDVAIRFTGLRPGEKLYEELFHGREAPVPTDAPGLKMATPRAIDLSAAAVLLQQIELASREDDEGRALALIRSLVPEFAHNPSGEVRRPGQAVSMPGQDPVP
ncbi:polysaccharide biosynthesis protein [Swaminathania salitolerans]|uniref:Polysaccharide biosynthesis protein CapD n=1 Tax=Swaminathania salitolerans TaxID=182838 RepID=A0A511BMJ4_9PROT|nr:nucleotide sugar epimerase dehydratase [Swaminathania salitolerans LMG 21291]GEL01547.1 polysaccharide biosynthesis protein CapD [Swaminathania salitolerans]